jgi:hypothetical protein
VHNSKQARSLCEEINKFVTVTAESSIASIDMSLRDRDVHISPISSVAKTIKRDPKQLPLKIPFHELFDKMCSLLTDEEYLLSSDSESVLQLNIREETDWSLTTLECIKDDEKLHFDTGKSKITEFRSSNNAVVLTQRRIVLDKFPIGDFEYPIYWNIDRKSYSARNIADLRHRHNVLIEGAFKKSSRGLIFDNYYGFLLASGTMLCFRNETLKKVVDFRESTVTILNRKHLKLSACGLSVGWKETKWQMKFSSRWHFKVWYSCIVQLTM